MDPDTCKLCIAAGANVLVAGSAVYKAEDIPAHRQLRAPDESMELMEYFPAPLEKLTEQFAKLPGVGRKSAQRLAFYVLSLPDGRRPRPLPTPL